MGRGRGWIGRSIGRWIARLTVALGALIVLVLLAPPLLLRGPVLRALARYQSKSLCGTIEIAGGQLDTRTIVSLILQRPFDVALDGVRIREPEGDDLFRANVVRLRLTVLRHPWRVEVVRALVAGGSWQLVGRGHRVPLTVALDHLRAEGRGSCRAPSPPETPQAPPPLGSWIKIDGVTLQDVSLVLSFSDWAVKMTSLDAYGTLDVRETSDGIQILFDARDIHTSRGGSLRIGPPDQARTFEIPFDRVVVSRVAVTGAAPRDLVLSVEQARTRAARLTGEVVFTDVLAPESRRRSGGMNLSARWTDFGDALERDPPWAAIGRRLAALHASARTSLRGPFDALVGSASVDGKGVSLLGQLLPHQRYALEARFKAFDTRPLLARDQRGWLGGHLDGRVSLNGRLGPGPQNRSIALDAIALALQREPSGKTGVPRRWVIERAPSSTAPLASRPADLHVTLGTVAAHNGELVVDRLRVLAPGVAVAARIRARGANRPELHARLAPESRVTWRGETFRPSAELSVETNASRDIAMAPFTITNVAGGAIQIAGSIRHDGRLDLHATVARYPLAHLPGVGRQVPGGLPSGLIDGALALGGTPQSPALSGRLALGGLRWGDRSLGDGAINFDASFHDGDLRIASLTARAAGVQATIAGRLRIDEADAGASTLDGTIGVVADGAQLGLWLGATNGFTGGGSADFGARVTGPLRALRVQGQARFQSLLVDWPSSPVGSIRLDGPLKIEGPVATAGPGPRLEVGPLLARLGSGGWILIAGARGPGRIQLALDRVPLRIDEIDLLVRGASLTTRHPIGGVSIRGLALALALHPRDPRAYALRLTGSVNLGHTAHRLGSSHENQPSKKTPRKHRPGDNPLERIWADNVEIVGPRDAVQVSVSYAPTITVGLRCAVNGPLAAPQIAGQVRGAGLYSQLALTVADWFTSRNLRKCDFGAH